MKKGQTTSHYDEDYFAWQSSLGEFGAWANRTKFSDYVSPQNDVLDFGCGGGFLLEKLNCRRKVGVEINPAAAETARGHGIEVHESVSELPDACVDLIISDNALEHTPRPLDVLEELYSKLRIGGKIVLVVPCESISYRYRPNDINQHLYSWSPMCLGNLLTRAGFSLVESKPYIHKWPPLYRVLAKLGGRRGFELVCRIYGRLARGWFQVRAVAEKKGDG